MTDYTHGDTRPCTACGSLLTWHADTRTWQGTHKPDCHVAGRLASAGMPTGVRGPAHDEREPIGANGQQLWHVTMQMGAPGSRFEEVIGVRAVTEEGALLLAQESRLNVVGLIAEPK